LATNSVSIVPATAALSAPNTTQLAVRVIYADQSTEDITDEALWSSSNAGIASVDAAGLVTAVAPGVAIITGRWSQHYPRQAAITVS
jgi:uncharacterized protein YjdB